MAFKDWSTTAADNDDADAAINWVEGQPAETVNNSGRGMMAELAKWRDDTNGTLTTGGTSSAYTVTSNNAYSAYFDGLPLIVSPNADSAAGGVTINVDTLGAKSIKLIDGTDPYAGAMQSGGQSFLLYDGTNFILLNAHPPITTRGDLIRGGASGVVERVALGTNGQLLGSDGTDAVYSDRIILGTEQSASGSSVDFTSIPSWVKKITVQFFGVSLSGTDNLGIQIGDAGGLETSGYAGSSGAITGTTPSTVQLSTSFEIIVGAATEAIHGSVILTLEDTTSITWVAQGVLGRGIVAGVVVVGGSKSLSATLDRLSIITSGTDTFDAGQVNILYQ